jgi:gag-polypeptide of LTR copia-type
MKVMRRWPYFIGLCPCPVPKDAANPTTDEADLIAKWEYEDSVASYLLSQRLLNTTEICLTNCSTTMERWDMVTKEYQVKSTFAQADLRQVFLDMQCAKGGNVREFLTSLGCKREELAAAGVKVTEEEYKQMILRGIPFKLVTYALHLLSSAAIIDKSASINLDALISHIC